MPGLPVPAPLRPLIRCGYRAGVSPWKRWLYLRKLLWVEPVLRSICERVGSGLRAEQLPYIRGHGRLVLGTA